MSYVEDKLTGRKIEFSCITIFDKEDDLGDSTSIAEFNSIKDLILRYKDYVPKDPIIKDKKIRKAIRLWADTNGIKNVWHEYSSCCLCGNGLRIEMGKEINNLLQGSFSIIELCGEREK